MSAIKLRLSAPLYKAVREIAEHDKIAINDFIALALEEKVAALRTQAFLVERAREDSPVKVAAVEA